jgi:hypothetical protein
MLTSAPTSAFQVTRTAFSGGGLQVSGGSFKLGATVSEAGIVGAASGGSFSLGEGFWSNIYRTIATDAVEELGSSIQWVNSLRANTPNPFRGATLIAFTVAEKSSVKLVVYDVTGRTVATLVNETRGRGTHRVHWEGRDELGHLVASGIYFSRLNVGSWAGTRKMLKIQ